MQKPRCLRPALRALAFPVAFVMLFLAIKYASARDLGQWQYAAPDISAWFKSLMQPDSPSVSCCGDSDAYWADQTDVDPVTGGLVAIITDTRDDAPLRRAHIPVGTRIPVPQSKIRKPAKHNPTGHTIIFVGASGHVYCYEPMPLT